MSKQSEVPESSNIPNENGNALLGEIVSTLISAYTESTKRTRIIFSLLNLLSIILLVNFFNSRLSWGRHPGVYDTVREDLYELDYKYLDKLPNVIGWCADTASLNDAQIRIVHRKSLAKLHEVNQLIHLPNPALGGKPTPVLEFQDSRSSGIKPTLPIEYKFLNLSFLGLHIYDQDIPLIGGFTVLVLLTWFFYARRREKGILTEIIRLLPRMSASKKLRYQIVYGVSFSAIFNTIRGLDNDSHVFAKSLSIWLIRFLLIMPCLMIALLQGYDTVENHIYGPAKQEYLNLGTGRGYLYGDELQYYISNFNISTHEVQRNVPTFEYIRILNNVRHLNKDYLRSELIILEVITFIFLIMIIINTVNIILLIKDEDVLKRTNIETTYAELVDEDNRSRFL